MRKAVLFTAREAAEIGGLPLNAVEKAIEQRVVRPVRFDSAQLICAREIALLVLLRELPVALPVALKRQARDWFVGLRRVPGARLELSPGLAIRVTSETVEALERLETYARLRDRYVEVDPGVMGGEPVFRATRVPVRDMAELVELGESSEVLCEDFPQVPEEARAFAIQWARANPRRGRPSAPWRRSERSRPASRTA